MKANRYGVLITDVATVSRPDGKRCVQVTWLDPNAPSTAPSGAPATTRGTARTVPGSTATTQALAVFHGSPERRVDVITNGRNQIVAIRDHVTGDLVGEQ